MLVETKFEIGDLVSIDAELADKHYATPEAHQEHYYKDPNGVGIILEMSKEDKEELFNSMANYAVQNSAPDEYISQLERKIEYYIKVFWLPLRRPVFLHKHVLVLEQRAEKI